MNPQSDFINAFAGQGYQKCNYGNIAFWLSQNAPEYIYRQLYGFYQDYPDAKVIHPNFYGLTDDDIFNAIDEFCCVIKKERTKLITKYLHPLDNYCANKYGDMIYYYPTFWFVVFLLLVWYVLILFLCKPFEWWYPFVGIIGGIPSIGVVGLVLSVVLQFLCTFVYNCYVTNKIIKHVREFSKSYVYMILQAQANYIQHYQADRNS